MESLNYYTCNCFFFLAREAVPCMSQCKGNNRNTAERWRCTEDLWNIISTSSLQQPLCLNPFPQKFLKHCQFFHLKKSVNCLLQFLHLWHYLGPELVKHLIFLFVFNATQSFCRNFRDRSFKKGATIQSMRKYHFLLQQLFSIAFCFLKSYQV